MKTCRRCGARLTTRNVTPGYKYYCPNCDEDMFGIEALDCPVVVVKDLGDGRMATRVSHFVVRAGKRRWAVSSRFYNPVAGGFEGFVVDRGPYRTKKGAEESASWYNRHVFPGNWWMITPDYVRKTARESGIIVRIVKEKHGKQEY